jgi:hypothetical protein
MLHGFSKERGLLVKSYRVVAYIGENSSFVIFGYKTAIGVTLGYILGYGLSAFTTFATILGRSTYSEKMCSCCSVLEQGSNGFVATLLMTFKNCGIGVRKMTQLYKQSNLKTILWTSIVILVTAETVCILTAETIDLIFYRHSLFVSIPLSLFAGAFAVVVPEAYKKTILYYSKVSDQIADQEDTYKKRKNISSSSIIGISMGY